MVAAKGVAEGLPKEEREERTSISEEHTEGGINRFLIRVIGHHPEHRAIRHIDTGIDGHHQNIRSIRPDEFGGVPPIGRSEKQYTCDGEERRNKEQVRAVLAPTCLRTIGYNPHHRIGDCVPDTRDKEDDPCILEREPEDVTVEERQVIGKDLPEHRRGHIAETVAYVAKPLAIYHFVIYHWVIYLDIEAFFATRALIFSTEAEVVKPSSGVLRQ